MAIQAGPSRFGQNQLAGATDALFLKVFSGEIIASFEEANVMMPLHRVRSISSGKSAQFPVAGVASAQYHTPGESLLSTGNTTGYGSTTSGANTAGGMTVAFDGGSSKYGTKFAHSEKTILIDDVLVASTFVADIDEMMNHYDVRSIYSTEIGRALAYTADKNLIRTVIGGARRTTDRFGGNNANYLGAQIDVSDASASTNNSEDLIAALFAAAQKMDEKNVPIDGRYAVLTPANYYRLVNGDGSKIAINKDYGGNGSIAKGSIVEIAGIRVFKSNHIPQTDESGANESTLHGASGVKNNVNAAAATGGYSGVSYANTQGIVFQTEGVGTVKLMDLSVESDYITERLGTLMLAKYAMGHDVLREECCFELVA